MIVAALLAAGLTLVGVGVILGTLLGSGWDDVGFSDERGGLAALHDVWESNEWEAGYRAAVEAFGYVYDPGVK